MRMTAIVASAGPTMRAYLDVVATCAALAFLLLIVCGMRPRAAFRSACYAPSWRPMTTLTERLRAARATSTAGSQQDF
jgi:hypothetical protein